VGQPELSHVGSFLILLLLLLLPPLLLPPQVPPVTLEWGNLSCHWTSKKKKQRKGEAGSKQILFNLSGAARPGRCVSAGAFMIGLA
jgi:hypothetical protein